MSSRNFTLLLCLLGLSVLINSACSGAPMAQANPSATPVIVIAESDDLPATTVIEQPAHNQGDNLPSAKTVQQTTERGPDDSEVSLSATGDGARLERRIFQNHPRLVAVLVRYQADGSASGTIHAHSGETFLLPASLLTRAMSASADEIANTAGITATKQPPLALQTMNQP